MWKIILDVNSRMKNDGYNFIKTCIIKISGENKYDKLDRTSELRPRLY